jgi:hypothetical protein
VRSARVQRRFASSPRVSRSTARLAGLLATAALAACSSKGTAGEAGAPAPVARDTAGHGGATEPAAGDTATATTPTPTPQEPRKDPMPDTKQPDPGPPPGYDTGIDRDGNLIRQRPENQPPPITVPPEMLQAHDDHVLLFAAQLAGDAALLRKAWLKLGLADAGGNPTPKMTVFMEAHRLWLEANPQRVQALMTPEKSRAYLQSHLK